MCNCPKCSKEIKFTSKMAVCDGCSTVVKEEIKEKKPKKILNDNEKEALQFKRLSNMVKKLKKIDEKKTIECLKIENLI